MKRIKIIHVITRFDKGGSAENTFLTVKGLDKHMYDILLVFGASHESAMSDAEGKAVQENLSEAEHSGVRTMKIDTLVRNVHPIKDLCTLWTLTRIFRIERPQIVHTHTSKAGILGRLAALFSRVPVIIHTPHGHVFWGYFNRWTSFFFVLLERWAAHITDRIIVLTEHEKKDHLHFRIAPDEKFDVIHSGVDLVKFLSNRIDPGQIKKDLGIPDRALVVGSVGRLAAIKGHRFLIEAAEEIVSENPDSFFLLLGDGELLQELRSLAVRRDVTDKIIFLGWRPNVAEIVSTFDIFVFPSLSEGMGKAVVEAMSLGKPIIASRVGGIMDLVIDGENGMLVPPADSGTLSARILHLLKNPGEMVRLGKAGMKTASSYDDISMIKKIDDVYMKCLNR